MADMLSISSTAVAAYQRALSTVSNNIANVSTDGYSRQDVALQSNTPAKAANSYLGTGVMFTAVKRQYDEFAESNLRKSTSDLMSQDPLVSYSQRVMDLMGDKSVGLSSALDQFFASASGLAADPASTVQRGSFARAATILSSRSVFSRSSSSNRRRTSSGSPTNR
jgi:flagellar hook-associated protein FlgK